MKIEEELVNKEAKVNFLKGLIRIAKADNKVDDEEWYFYSQAAISLNLEDADIEELQVWWKSTDKPQIEFLTMREKLFFFIQAVQLCWVDNDYSLPEKEEITLLQNELGVNPDNIQKIEQWVKEGMDWSNRGNDLLNLK